MMINSSKSTEGRVILGIDPGTTVMGYSVICQSAQTPKLLTIGILKLHKYDDHYVKLQRIFERTVQLINEYKPDELAIEAPFYGKNVQSMLKLGRAQGAAISAALSRNIPIFEYAPRKIKMAISGHGTASKDQVAAILRKVFKYDELPDYLDATDALAAALCHSYQKKFNSPKGIVKNWKSFISQNPGRVK